MTAAKRELLIDTILDELIMHSPGQGEKVQMLLKANINVKISFEQMLDYANKLRKQVKVKDIKDLLQIYMDMAKRYYAQYEHSLVQDVLKQYKTQEDCKTAVERIESLNDPELTPAIEHLIKLGADAGIKYDRLLDDFPVLLQSALDKLRDEWQRLGSIAVASQVLTKDKSLIGFLEAVVNVAAHSIGIEAERIVVVPGRECALYFFTYVDNFAILTVPIYSVQAPWEWSIFWHELAGYKVRHLMNHATLDIIRENLTKNKKALANIKWIWDNPYSRKYLQDVFSASELDLGDLGDFDHQFERMLENLPKKNRLQIYQEIRNQGWSVSWLKELFEDAWSVLAIGDKFILFFEDVLKRHGARDDRHPPLKVRIQVARELINLINPQNDSTKTQSKTPEAIAAEQILKFISLLIAANRKLATDDKAVLDLQDLRDQFLIGMQENIQEAIDHWSKGFPSYELSKTNAHGTADRAKTYAERFIKRFSSPEAADEVAKLISAFATYNEENQIKPGNDFFDTLETKDYKELIALSFYDADFGFPASSIKNIRFGKSILQSTKKTFTAIANTVNIILDGSSKVPGLGGANDVTYDGPDGVTYHAPIQNWNQAFASQSQYKLP